jgi:aryl-alcohol dehydrogenase-like predicted oxidoreductase
MTDLPPLERRPIHGTTVETSILGLAFDPSPSAPPPAGRAIVVQLRKARASGITTFDVGESRSPVRAIQLLTEAFPEHDPDLLVILGAPSKASGEIPHPPGKPRSAGGGERPVDSLTEVAKTAAQLNQLGSVFVDWDPRRNPEIPFGDLSNRLDRLVGARAIVGWSLRCRSEADLRELKGPGTERPISAELSLLDRRLLGSFIARFEEKQGSVLVRNPFADGRLDGTRFSATLSERGPRAAPVDLGSLSAEFAPVLQLAPLTRAHRRTLVQAALQYLVHWPWVATVLLPLPSPERWEDVRAALEAPPLETEELRAAGLVSTSTDRTTARDPSET